MWKHLCVYDPGLGDEDSVEKQLLYTEGNTDFIKLIGLSQGIAELSNALSESPARWFETSSGKDRNVVVVVPLANSAANQGNWRHGCWFAGEYTLESGEGTGLQALPPLAAYRSVELAFSQHCLLRGRDFSKDEYWSEFGKELRLWKPMLSALVAPQAILCAPGTLNQEIANKVGNLATENNALDVFIFTKEGAVYPGKELDIGTRRELLRWLATKTYSTTGYQQELTPDEDAGRKSFSLISAVQNYIPFSLQMPQVSTLAAPLWRQSTAPEETQNGVVVTNAKFYDNEGKPFYVTSWKEPMFTYAAAFASPIDAKRLTERLLDPLCLLMEGFSFAFAPPVRFYYMVLTNDNVKITSTFPESIENNEAFLTLLNGFPTSQQVVRLASTWLYFVTMKNDTRVVFGKKNVDAMPSFLDALHSDVQLWIEDYERRPQ